MHIISKIAMITINETLFVEMISFLIFLFLINRIMFKPLRATMSERDGYILGVEDDIQDAGCRLDALNREIKENESAVVEKALEDRNKLEEEGSIESEKIFVQAKSEIENIRAENHRIMAEQLFEAKKKLARESEELAVAIIEKVLDRRVVRG
ncbi:MAG: ATP synthase F0 subunit B [Deltaproteobacteria bacterium]|nr:ATP synthase F0 subunit B [Deltaproteobacteria bacterium]